MKPIGRIFDRMNRIDMIVYEDEKRDRMCVAE
jgi:hypothetical protein